MDSVLIKDLSSNRMGMVYGFKNNHDDLKNQLIEGLEALAKLRLESSLFCNFCKLSQTRVCVTLQILIDQQLAGRSE